MTPAVHSGAEPFLRLAGRVWELGARLRAWGFRAGLLPRQHLRAPVVSIGNLTFGGTGKTPVAIWLARELASRGYAVSILTRGYRRTSKGLRIHLPGNSRRPEDAAPDGDEVQLFLRHLPEAAVGVAARRVDAGRALEARAAIDMHLLDDGFQHLRLARACDIVLIDSSAPWGSRAIPGTALPRLSREPVEALRRADAFILTRCEQADPAAIEEIESTLRKIHPAAPLFRCRTRMTGFRVSLDQPALPAQTAQGRPAVAFCGIGNPESFLAMLRAAGLSLVATRAFPDHHHYNDQDIDQLNDLVRSHNAALLLTTEKDVVNLPHPARFADNFIVPAQWAEISLDIEGGEDLLRLVIGRAGEKIRPLQAGSARN